MRGVYNEKFYRLEHLGGVYNERINYRLEPLGGVYNPYSLMLINYSNT